MFKEVNILIFGLGNIGKSYLKGLVKSKLNLNIYTYDLKKQSILFKIKNKKTSELYNLDQLPKAIDLCIISTSSKNKLLQIKKIFKYTTPKNIIMEKLIAQNLLEIQKIKKFLNNKKCNVWVNTQMRTYRFFNKLKKFLKNKKIKQIKLKGNDWGLACNSIHYIDLYSWLLNNEVSKIKLFCSPKKFYKSKRKGYFEFFGKLVVIFHDNLKLEINCKKENKKGKILHEIKTENDKIIFDESKNIIINKSKTLEIKAKQKMIFEQINILLYKILKGKDPGLPMLNQSSKLHNFLFEAICVSFYGSVEKKKNLNIT